MTLRSVPVPGQREKLADDRDIAAVVRRIEDGTLPDEGLIRLIAALGSRRACPACSDTRESLSHVWDAVEERNADVDHRLALLNGDAEFSRTAISREIARLRTVLLVSQFAGALLIALLVAGLVIHFAGGAAAPTAIPLHEAGLAPESA